MSDRYFAVVLVGLAASLGWFWRVAAERDIPIQLFAGVLEMLLIVWLWRRLDRGGDA